MTARVQALAKLNLDLRVIGKRPDGYHELRTIFQTISLSDRIGITFARSRRTKIVTDSNVKITDNLMEYAARLVLDELRLTGRISFTLEKRIPMGAGLGGGSSDAAAVLLALPVLAGGIIEMSRLIQIGSQIGSDVPFFLLGGCALGLGRGTELYPLADPPVASCLLITPQTQVSTKEAYRALSLTSEFEENKIVSFQTQTWRGKLQGSQNDFEEVVFRRHPELAAIRLRLAESGAEVARMSGSGSSVFAIFRTRARMIRAVKSFADEQVHPVSFVSRPAYHALWRRWLAQHITKANTPEKLWPPQSRYAR